MYSDREGKVRKAIYFNKDEWSIIELRAEKAKMDTSKYIRKVVIEGSLTIYDFREVHNLVYEINKIGVNVNQIAKKANELDNIYKSDVVKLKREYNNLCLTLNQYLLKLPSTKV